MKNHEHLTPALSPLGRGEGDGTSQTCPHCGCSGQEPDSLKCDDCGKNLPAAMGRGESTQPSTFSPQPVLKVTLTHGEFEMVRWAQRLCRWSRARRRAVGIAEFARGALLDAVGQTISEVLARPGGFVPPEIAKNWEIWKAESRNL